MNEKKLYCPNKRCREIIIIPSPDKNYNGKCKKCSWDWKYSAKRRKIREKTTEFEIDICNLVRDSNSWDEIKEVFLKYPKTVISVFLAFGSVFFSLFTIYHNNEVGRERRFYNNEIARLKRNYELILEEKNRVIEFKNQNLQKALNCIDQYIKQAQEKRIFAVLKTENGEIIKPTNYSGFKTGEKGTSLSRFNYYRLKYIEE